DVDPGGPGEVDVPVDVCGVTVNLGGNGSVVCDEGDPGDPTDPTDPTDPVDPPGPGSPTDPGDGDPGGPDLAAPPTPSTGDSLPRTGNDLGIALLGLALVAGGYVVTRLDKRMTRSHH